MGVRQKLNGVVFLWCLGAGVVAGWLAQSWLAFGAAVAAGTALAALNGDIRLARVRR